MGVSKAKPSSTNPEDIDALKSDVASFASSLGLASSLPSSGFNDSDFRKSGPLKPTKAQNKPTQKPNARPQAENAAGKPPRPERKNNAGNSEKPKPKPPVLSLDESNKPKGFDRFKNLPKLPLIKASALAVWYEDAAELEAKVVGEGAGRGEVKSMEEWYVVVAKNREMGERLMAQYAQDYELSRGKTGDIKMLTATQRSGTAADKVSAFSVMVGDNPIANLRSLDALLSMVTSKVGKRHALTGFEAVKELFVSSLLPDRKLKTLVHRPLSKLPENKDGYSLLLFWYWEECLKQRYERFVSALEEGSRDMLPILKDKALKTVYALLKSKSEQERRLLSCLVNKLGDPQNKGASNADFHLSNLLSDHPNMKAVVIDEVDSFLFRPHLRLRSKYHAVNFLSQIRLGHKGDGPKVAKRLIDVYFALFKVLITEADGGSKTALSNKSEGKKTPASSKDGKAKNSSESHVELDSRLLSALLTGVNRAFPFVSSNEADDIVEVQTPMLFQLVHSKNFNVGIQALMLLDKISSKNQIVSDRFYRALYSKLLLQATMNSSKAEMFIGLLLRAMKSDVNLKRVSAFVKRLLQVALQQPPQYSCGCLFLLSEVLKARPHLWNMVHQSESIDDEEVEHFEDVVEETDKEASTKVSNKQESDKVAPIFAVTNSDGDSSDEEEHPPISDSEDELSDEARDLILRDGSGDTEPKTLSGHNEAQAQQPSARPSLPGGYDPRHREPSYCNADRASWWELTVLASHVHPSVSTMARTLLSGANVVYNGNPLNDLALTAFLDKLMEKKPKATQWHGGSQIEPAKKLDMNENLIGSKILSLAEMDVPPEDFVFHKFYMNKMNSTKKPKKKKKSADEEAAEELFDVDGGDDDDDDVSDKEIDNVLDSAMEADGDYDYDDLDQVAGKDDDDLIGSASDSETDGLDIAEGEDFSSMDEGDEEDDDDIDIGNADDGSEDDGEVKIKIDTRKGKRKAGASPFASLEEYEHLLDEEDGSASARKKKKKKEKEDERPNKSQKKEKNKEKERPNKKSQKKKKSSK